MQRNCPACWGTGKVVDLAGRAEKGKDPDSSRLVYGHPCTECGGSGVEQPVAVVPRLRGVVPWDDVVAVLVVALIVLAASVMALVLNLVLGGWPC